MIKSYWRWLLLLGLIASLSGARTAYLQSLSRIEIVETAVDDTPFVHDDDFPQVQLDVIPVDSSGVPLHTLAADAFFVEEAGVPVVDFSVTPFVNESHSVSLLLLLDTGATMRDDLPQVRAAIIDLYDAHLHQSDESALLAFAQLADDRGVDLGEPFPRLDAEREIGFGNDEGARINLLNGLTVPNDAGSPLYDAVVKGARMSVAQARYRRRAVVLITDGGDATADGRSPASNAANAGLAVAEAQQLGIPVFTIGIGGQADTAFLARLAESSGGRFTAVDSSNQVGFVLAEIVAWLKHAYRLQYTSPLPADGETHSLLVGVQTGGETAEALVTLRAYLPRIPQVQELWARPARAQTAVPLASLPAVRGAVTVEPQIAARGQITAVNYYVNDSPTAAHSATAPPYSFYWDTSVLSPDEIHTLFVEVLDDANPPHVGTVQTAVLVAACNFFCHTQQQVGLTAVHFFAGGALLLTIALLLLLRDRKRAPASTVFGAPVVTPGRPVFERIDSDDLLYPVPAARPQTPRAVKTELLAPVQQSPALAFLFNPQTETLYPVRQEISIGSDVDNDVCLSGNKVDKWHARLTLIDGRYILLAVTQAYLTKVNQKDVLRHELLDGDRLQIGETLLIFRRITAVNDEGD